MNTLFAWKAKRAGAAITITHSTGKLTGVTEITLTSAGLFAFGPDGRCYELATTR